MSFLFHERQKNCQGPIQYAHVFLPCVGQSPFYQKEWSSSRLYWVCDWWTGSLSVLLLGNFISNIKRNSVANLFVALHVTIIWQGFYGLHGFRRGISLPTTLQRDHQWIQRVLKTSLLPNCGFIFKLFLFFLYLLFRCVTWFLALCLHSLFQVLELESLFLSPDCFRDDLAHLLRAVQAQEKSKLQLVCIFP